MRQPARLAAGNRHRHPSMRPRPQPPGLACGGAALAPGAVSASAPHPTTLKADVTFFYAAACSACRRQRGFVLPPCWRVNSKLRLDVVIIFASSAASWLARRYALAIRNAAAGALRPFGYVTYSFCLFRLSLNSKFWAI